ncbi:MAG: hypothetical protein RSB86_16570 [Comamonas sp.]|uniref:head-tail joining protein n=1 Tax=Comamonas sp. TaxID=34028 RepID=UPI002FC84627
MTQNLAPFAAVGALINQGVSQHLANALCTFNSSQPFGVIFDRVPRDALGIVSGYAPSCSFCVVNAPGLGQGGCLQIDGVAYEVVEPVEPDASGWVTLQLREVGHG